MTQRIAIYTAIFGPYDGLLPQKKFPNVDYICFTDQTFSSKTWKIVHVDPQIDGAGMDNRQVKICPHLFLKDYEVSIYIDGNFLVMQDPTMLVKQVLENHHMGLYDHNQTLDKRNCVFEEAEVLYQMERDGRPKESSVTIKKQMDRYKSEGYPADHGLITAAVLVRRHHEPSVVSLMQAWWHELNTESRRDQLSFNYVAWKQEFPFFTINGNLRNNSYFYMIGQHRKDYRWKYFRYRVKKMFGIVRDL